MKRIPAILIILVLLVCAAVLTASASRTSVNASASPSPGSEARPADSGASGQSSLPAPGQMIMRQAAKSDTSAPLRSMPPIALSQGPAHDRPLGHLNKSNSGAGSAQQGVDAVVQKLMGPFTMPTPIQNF